MACSIHSHRGSFRASSTPFRPFHPFNLRPLGRRIYRKFIFAEREFISGVRCSIFLRPEKLVRILVLFFTDTRSSPLRNSSLPSSATFPYCFNFSPYFSFALSREQRSRVRRAEISKRISCGIPSGYPSRPGIFRNTSPE